MSGNVKKCNYCQEEWDNYIKDDDNPYTIWWGLCQECRVILDKYRKRKN